MERGDRGQLFVLAALALAVLVIGVAVLLNSGLYSANMAAQNAEQGVDEPREFLREAEIGANRVMEYSNYNNYSNYVDLRRSFTVGVHNWSERAHIHRARTGEGVEIREVNVTNGSRVTQDTDTRGFTSSSGAVNWTVVNGASGIRQFRMNVSYGSLENTTPGFTTRSGYFTSDYFRINISDVSSTPPTTIWRIYVYRNDLSPNRILLRVEDPTGDISSPCSSRVNSDGRATLYLSDGLVGQEHCEALTFLDSPATPFAINFTNGGAIHGSYEMFLNKNHSTIDKGDYGTHPSLERAIYSGTLAIDYTADSAILNGNRTATPERRRLLESGDPFSVPVGGQITFNNGSDLTILNRSGSSTSYNVPANVEGIGPTAVDIDGDSDDETPWVKNNNFVQFNPPSPITLAQNATYPTTLAVGSWPGNSPSIFYAGSTGGGPSSPDDMIRGVNRQGGSNKNFLVYEDTADGVAHVAGISEDVDITSAGEEFVYVDDSNTIKYVNSSGLTSTTTGVSLPGSSTDPPAIGTPADYNDNGTARIPFVDGAGNVKLASKDGGVSTLPSGNATQAPMATTDWDGDGTLDIIYVEAGGTNDLRVIYDVTGENRNRPVRDSSGSVVTNVDTSLGVR